MQVVANASAPPVVSVDADALLDDDLLELVEQAPEHCVAVQDHGDTIGILRLEDVVHRVAVGIGGIDMTDLSPAPRSIAWFDVLDEGRRASRRQGPQPR